MKRKPFIVGLYTPSWSFPEVVDSHKKQKLLYINRECCNLHARSKRAVAEPKRDRKQEQGVELSRISSVKPVSQNNNVVQNRSRLQVTAIERAALLGMTRTTLVFRLYLRLGCSHIINGIIHCIAEMNESPMQ
jgi:hypothetical protein